MIADACKCASMDAKDKGMFKNGKACAQMERQVHKWIGMCMDASTVTRECARQCLILRGSSMGIMDFVLLADLES